MTKGHYITVQVNARQALTVNINRAGKRYEMFLEYGNSYVEVKNYDDTIKNFKQKGHEAKGIASGLGQGLMAIAILGIIALVIPPLRWNISILICILLLMIYIISPFPVQVVLFIANLFVPDPLPYIDECVMAMSTLNKARGVYKALRIFEWTSEYKKISLAIVGGVAIVLFGL